MKYFLGIDIGGTSICAALTSNNLDIIGSSSIATPALGEFSAVIPNLIKSTCNACNVPLDSIYAVGIGSVGPIDIEHGTLSSPANIKADQSQINIVKIVKEVVPTSRIILRQDTTCGALAEHHRVGDSNLVYLTISTGIGAGIIINDREITGNIGEIGHMVVDSTLTMQCQCGSRGHWEAYCGGANIPRYALYLSQEKDISTQLPVDSSTFSAEEIFQKAGCDPLADYVIQKITDWNTIGIINIVQAFAPSRISIGGGVARNNPQEIISPLSNRIKDRTLLDPPTIDSSVAGADAVLEGAILAAQQEFLR